ncbi:MAG: hypothetical protein LBT05_10700 [Planctomycetaceae bacterium]|jgi:hypothetical protein|nr:hypothetical protein [Planctomycetaceae bacterium]
MTAHNFLITLTTLIFSVSAILSAQETVVVEGTPGLPASGKRVVLLAGDEEYRSEEMLTQMARILAKRHGMTCTVLYSINPKTQEIDPNTPDNIPGLELLDKADLMIVFLRFRNLPDEQMDCIVKYLESGRPVLGIRPSVVAFAIPAGRKWSQYGWQTGKGEWQGGFGRRVLGETWISHHGNHKVEATRGEIVSGREKHPIVTGCRDIFGTTDVYTVRLPLPGDAQPLVLGTVLKGLNPEDPPVDNEKNNPKMPILWTKSYCVDNGKTGLAVTSTIGAGNDFLSEGVRRLLVNSCYWLLQMPDKISPELSVDFVGEYQPLDFGFNIFRKGLTTSDVIQHKTPF